MDMNNKLTLNNVAEFIDKNNEKILDRIGTGGSTSISQEVGNAITQKGDGIFVQDYSTNIVSLENRSIIGSQLSRCLLRNSAKQTLAVNGTVKFDTLISTDGMEYNLTNYSIKLKGGTTYDIRVSIHTGVSGASSFCVYDITNSKAITDTFYAISPNYDGSMNSDGSIGRTYKCEQDIEIVVKVKASTSQELQYSDGFYSVFEVVEVGRTVLLDPVKYAQEHEVKVSTFGISAETTVNANTPVVFNTVNGNIPLTNNGYVQLEKDVTYIFSASIYNNSQTATQTGIRIYDVTNGANISYIGVNGHSSGTVKYTATQNIEVSIIMGATVQLEPTYTHLTVQEIKNPVVVEYNSIGFTKETLWSGELSDTSVATLSKPITDYDILLLTFGFVSNSKTYQKTETLNTEEIESTNTYDITIGSISGTHNEACRLYAFPTTTTFNFTNGKNIVLSKVVGIKSKESAGDIATMTTEEVNTMLNDIFGGE